VKRSLFVILALGIGTSAGAMDFGFISSVEPLYESSADLVKVTSSYVPWFSAFTNEKAGFYISARFGFEQEFTEGDPWRDVFFELNRTELSIRPNETVYLLLGRQWYQDSGGMIAAGLFDGLHSAFSLGRVRLEGGVFSSALLNKKTMEIRMTPKDVEIYEDSDRVFGSNRMLVVLGGEFPDLSSRTSLSVSALAQIDLNDGRTQALDSQYLTALYRIDALSSLRLALTAIGGLTEQNGEGRGNLGAALTLDWDVPGSLADMVTGEFHWGSGAVNTAIGPLAPVTMLTRGMVFTPSLPGLMDVRLSYGARFHRTLSLNAATVFFFRTDAETLTDPGLDPASKERYIGLELYGQLVWALQSPLRITAGGGVFLPGGAFGTNRDPRWKINTGITLSL
jgi:hypothetical protein